MKRRFVITGLFCGLLMLAVAGWLVQGVRWTVARPRQRRPAVAPPARSGYVTRAATS